MIAVQKKESPNSRSGKRTPLILNDKNLVLINRNFSAIGQLNEPFIDCIFEGSVDVITSILEWFSAGTDCHLFREEIAFIMYIIDLTATFADSV